MPSEDRRHLFGGSDVGCIFGVSPWKTALDLYEEKVAPEFIPPEVEPKREKLFRRGKKLEPWVMELLEEERGIFIQKRNQRYVDPEFPWMAAEIDFEYMDTIGLCNGDVKTVSPFAASEWGEEQTDEIPLTYCLQFHHGMMVTGRPACLVAVLIGADDLRTYEVKRDDELIAEIRKREIQFWTEHVQKKVPPPSQTVGDVHKTLFRYGGFPVQNDPEIMTALSNLRTVKKTEKEVETLKKEYELQIKRRLLVLAEAHGLTDADAPKKFVINDMTGKRTASLSYEHRSGYSVGPADFWCLRT
jgi:putative phage-type endonuclease